MTMKPGIKEALWMAAGAAVLAAVLALALHLRDERSPADRLAARDARADLVTRMQLTLTSASEAEKNAVLAVTDEASQTFADRARASTADVERQRGELAALLATDGTPAERDLLAKFADAFTEYRRVDDEVLGLAVRNTNLKASALAFGPAADAAGEFDAALARVAAAHADSADAKRMLTFAAEARIAVLRIETLLPPHIAEESAPKMDELEKRMAADDERVRADLAALAALPSLRDDPDLATAASRYGTFGELRTQILALSRENTNVRSLALSLNQKRKATLVCLDELAALRDAVLAEPIPGGTAGRPVSPR